MGFFDKLNRKKQSVSAAPSSEEETPPVSFGWDAVTAALERLYPGQTDPKHYGTLVPWTLGGNDPLNGISIYDGGDYWHFVTFGLTELYGKTSEDPAVSGYGYEMTFKLRKHPEDDAESEIRCVCGILQAIARITFTKGEVFGPYEFIYTGQTAGIDSKSRSNITGFICVPEPLLPPLNTPNGRAAFLELVGLTDAELRTLSTMQSVKDLYEKLGTDVTSYRRSSLVSAP